MGDTSAPMTPPMPQQQPGSVPAIKQLSRCSVLHSSIPRKVCICEEPVRAVTPNREIESSVLATAAGPQDYSPRGPVPTLGGFAHGLGSS